MVAPHDVQGLADALLREHAVCYEPERVARTGARGDWAESANELLRVLSSVAGQ